MQYEYKYDKAQAPATAHHEACTARFWLQACGLFSGHAQLGLLSVFQVPGLPSVSCMGCQRYEVVYGLLNASNRRGSTPVHFKESHYKGERLGPGAYLRGQTHVLKNRGREAQLSER